MYESRSATVASATVGSNAPVTRSATIQSNLERSGSELVKLNWKILNASRIAEVQLVSLVPDVSTQGELNRYPIVEGRLPTQLRSV